MNPDQPRRRLLCSAVACLGAACTAPLRAAVGDRPLPGGGAGRPRELWITRPQAQESARAVYWADGALQIEGYRAINRIYRDLYAGLERPIALGLLNLNCAMQRAIAQIGPARPMVLLSGFRTVETNRRVGGVEPSSHFVGEADDYIYPGLSFEDNLRLACLFQVGGLGVYPDRGSLHKDLGRWRVWVEYGRPTSVDPVAAVRTNRRWKGGSF
jgi:uncharacterized protein YcbK (DUF882 family)